MCLGRILGDFNFINFFILSQPCLACKMRNRGKSEEKAINNFIFKYLKQKSKAQHAVQNSNVNYTHVETPQAHNDNNNNHKPFKPQEANTHAHINTSTTTTYSTPVSIFSLLWQGWEWQLENHSASEPGWSGDRPQWHTGLSDPLKTANHMTTDRKLQTWCQSQPADIRFWNIRFDGNPQICSPKTALESIQFQAFLYY